MDVLAVVGAVAAGLALGALGGGGSILMVPLLVYVAGEPENRAIAESLLIVGATSAVAAVPRGRDVAWRSVALFAPAAMVGAWGGGRLAAFVPSDILMWAFILVMVATAAGMLRGRSAADVARAPAAVLLASGAAVGLFAGLVGAGGGFLIVPALVMFGGVPMRQAVPSSLVVIALQSFAGFLGHIQHASVDWTLSAALTVAAVIGAAIGLGGASRVPQDTLRRGFGVFVLVIAVVMAIVRLRGYAN